MSKEPVAVVGIGQTKHVAARRDVSIAGLVREAAQAALDDAELPWADIDAVVIGKAPDFFEGVMMPELYLADALGAVGKPMLRVHTAGSVGGSTALVAANLVAARVHGTVLTLAFEKQSESNAMWGLSLPIPFQQPLLADTELTANKAYGVWQLKKLWGREYMGTIRTTFVVDAKGRVTDVIKAQRIKGHAQKVLDAVKGLVSPTR